MSRGYSYVSVERKPSLLKNAICPPAAAFQKRISRSVFPSGFWRSKETPETLFLKETRQNKNKVTQKFQVFCNLVEDQIQRNRYAPRFVAELKMESERFYQNILKWIHNSQHEPKRQALLI